MKAAENIRKNVPQFLHVRNQMYGDKQLCPEIKMSFAFIDMNDGTTHYVQEGQTPLKKFQRDPQFKKLYEEAHIEV